MNLLSLKSEVSKIYKGYAFQGDNRARIEKRFEDNDWIFVAKTIRLDVMRGTITFDLDLPIVLAILATRTDVNQKYVYAEVKNVHKELQILPALWKSYKDASKEYLRQRMLESVSLAIELAKHGSNLSEVGWCQQMQTAAFAALAYLAKERENAALSKPASRRSRKKDPGGLDSPA